MNYINTKKQREKHRDTLIFLSILIPATMALILSSCSAVHAATVTNNFTVPNNPIETSTHFSNKPINGSFSDIWHFTVQNPMEAGFSATQIRVGGGLNVVGIRDFAAVLDITGANLTFELFQDKNIGADWLTLLVPNLSIGEHTITISGNSQNGSYGGDISVIKQDQPVATPIPAAVWLFGSGLAGIIGLSRRKKQHN